jgi:RNA polymerase sigma factor (sigma-70 family)
MHDWQLIQEYVCDGSESAFRELVDRHLNFVYAAAVRQVHEPQLAEEITQAVFILMARKAGGFRRDVILPGWLFRTTHFIAQRALRSERRRQQREQEAFAMQPLDTAETAAPALAPLLDEALAQLPVKDRDALLLRFMQDQTLRQVGEHLGWSEEAAKKRVSRAIDKLRAFFAARGFTVSGTVLMGVLGTRTGQAASPALSQRVASVALAHAAGGSALLPPLVEQTLQAWRWAKWKVAGGLASATLVLLIAVSLVTPSRPGAEDTLRTGTVVSDAAAARSVIDAQPPSAPAQQVRPGQRGLDLLVLARDDSAPITNANLVLQTVIGGRWDERHDLKTDGHGRAEVPCPHGLARLDVGVLGDGFAARYVSWRPGQDDPVPAGYILRLDRVTNSAGGILHDEDGLPVAGAEVIAEFWDRGDSSAREAARERRGLPCGAVISRSGADGRWRSAAFPINGHGGFNLSASHPDFARTSIAADDPRRATADSLPEKLGQLWAGTLATRLQRAATLNGRVVDESDVPVAGALVAHAIKTSDELKTITDQDGRFVFTRLPRDRFGFCVSAAGYAPEYRDVELADAVNTIELNLKPGGTLRLHAIDETGQGVAGVTVTLEQWGQHRHKLSWNGTTGPDGRLEWNSAPANELLELCAYGNGWCYTRDIRVRAGEQEHTIHMRRTFTLEGRVTDTHTGQPITNCKSFPGYGEGEYSWERGSTRRHQDGTYTVRFEENRAPWRFRVEADGYEPFISEPIEPEATGQLDITMKPLDRAAHIRGVVWRPNGDRAAGAEVALLTLEHNATLWRGKLSAEHEHDPLVLAADGQGGFVFAPNSLAHSIVAVSPEGFARVRLGGQRDTVSIRLQPWGRVEGVIAPEVLARRVDRVMLTDPAAPNYSGHIKLDPRNFHVDPDMEGRFHFDFVPPLPLGLSLHSGLGVPYHHLTPLSPLPGETTRVRIADTGIRVTGKFTSPPQLLTNWVAQTANATVACWKPVPAAPAGLNADAAKLWLVDFWQSPQARELLLANRSVNLKIGTDGTFESSEGLDPGAYQLQARVAGVWVQQPVTVPEPAAIDGYVLNLGDLPVSH